MPKRSDAEPQKAANVVAMKEERARTAAKAMRDYEADKIAVRAKSARLRALRLAKEAADAAVEVVKPAKPRRASGPAKRR